MRGKGCLLQLHSDYCRITPAYAGKSCSSWLRCFLCGDHPRVCGEKARASSTSALRMGSPPRMRGKVVLSCTCHACPGITPAYAGKRVQKGGVRNGTQDHPRVCGEKLLKGAYDDGVQGSPPRMRGKDAPGTFSQTAKGITPAYAGKSTPPRWRQCAHWDHPRICGEKGVTQQTPPSGGGITPAYAGKSSRQYMPHLRRGDHPRICGEKTKNIP